MNKILTPVVRWTICLLASLFLSACVMLRPASVRVNSDLRAYKYAYIPASQTLQGGTAIPVGTIMVPITESVNPRDVIAGFLLKQGYILVTTLDDRPKAETLIVNYGESGRRDVGLGGYTIEVTIQFISAETGSILGVSSAEGCGSTEASDIKQAITRALSAIFKPHQSLQLIQKSSPADSLSSYPE